MADVSVLVKIVVAALVPTVGDKIDVEVNFTLTVSNDEDEDRPRVLEAFLPSL